MSSVSQVWTPETGADGVSLLRTKGRPFVCWGTEEHLALFRCLSCESAVGTSDSSLDLISAVYKRGVPSNALFQLGKTPEAPTPANTRGDHLARCRMAAPVLLPIFEHENRAKAVGVIEVARTVAQPLASFALLSSLAACLQDAGIYTSDLKAVAADARRAPDPLLVASTPTEHVGSAAAGRLASDDANDTQASGSDTPPSTPPSHQPLSPTRATATGKLPDPEPAHIKTGATSPMVAAAVDTLLTKAGSPRSSYSADTGARSGGGSGGIVVMLARHGSGSSLDARSDTSSWVARSSPRPSQQATTAVSQLQPQLQSTPQQLQAPQPFVPSMAPKAADPDDLAALPGLNDAQRLMFQAFGPAYNPDMKQQARSLAAQRTAAQGTGPARQPSMLQQGATAAAVQAAGSRKQLQRSGSAASEGAIVARAPKRQKRANGRRANAAGPSQPGLRYSDAPIFAPQAEALGWDAASGGGSTPGLPPTSALPHIPNLRSDSDSLSQRAGSVSQALPAITTAIPIFDGSLLPDVPVSLPHLLHGDPLQEHMPMPEALAGFFDASAVNAPVDLPSQWQPQAQQIFDMDQDLGLSMHEGVKRGGGGSFSYAQGASDHGHTSGQETAGPLPQHYPQHHLPQATAQHPQPTHDLGHQAPAGPSPTLPQHPHHHQQPMGLPPILQQHPPQQAHGFQQHTMADQYPASSAAPPPASHDFLDSMIGQHDDDHHVDDALLLDDLDFDLDISTPEFAEMASAMVH